MDNGQLTMAGFKNNLSYMSSLIFIYYNYILNCHLSTARCVPDGTQAALSCFFYRPFAPGGALIPSIFLTKRH